MVGVTDGVQTCGWGCGEDRSVTCMPRWLVERAEPGAAAWATNPPADATKLVPAGNGCSRATMNGVAIGADARLLTGLTCW